MSRRARVLVLALLMVVGAAGCCASPYRMYQSAYGFNNPRPERYYQGPPAPRITPPGPTTPAVLPEFSSPASR